MLSVSGSGDGVVSAAEHHESGGFSGGSSDVGGSGSVPGMDGSERGGGGGNRWPRQETLALLEIRSAMDVAFRDSNLKGPLWEEVSRKMADLGFQRSAKKCKEKFENVFKYHKRTKDGRQSKPDAKSYRFFDQLEALENNPPPSFPPPPSTITTTTTMAVITPNASSVPSHVNVSSTTSTPTPISLVSPRVDPATQIANNNPINTSFQSTMHLLPPQSTNAQNPPPIRSNSTSSSTSSDEDIQRRRRKKRKWKDYFQRLLNDVIQKQEDTQNKFLDALEKRERDRMAREDAWRVQEMARMNREHELFVHERSVAAPREAALITFLHKVTEQHDLQIPITKNADAQPPQATKQVQPPTENPHQSPEKPQPPPQQSNFQQPSHVPTPHAMTITPIKMSVEAMKSDNGGDSSTKTSSSRWPKPEIEALINIRTNLDLKYQENGPKGPLWEEISIAMGRIGYNRSSKRCKEKWENINKYFKKVKESSKKRPEDSKTCPYFHQLDALYKERAKKNDVVSSFNVPRHPSSTAPIMAQPEQQWPLHPQQPPDSVMRDQNHNESENDDDDLEEDDDGEEDEGGSYDEVVTNEQPFSGTS